METIATPTPIKTIPGKNGGTLHPGANGHNVGVKKGTKNLRCIFDKILSYRCKEDLTMLGIDTRGIPEEELATLTNGEVIALQLASKALRGDTQAAAMIYDRTEGKAIQVNQNLNTEMSYAEFLDTLAKDEKERVEELLA